jgi:hypothetical protein
MPVLSEQTKYQVPDQETSPRNTVKMFTSLTHLPLGSQIVHTRLDFIQSEKIKPSGESV